MFELVKKYVNSLSLSQVKSFAENNRIVLTDYEAEVVYRTIKNDFELLLMNEDAVFNKVQGQISPDSMAKIKELFRNYKQKYKNYL